MNKEENGTDVVVTSALWHMEDAIGHAVERVMAGTFGAENYKEWTMLAKDGASLAPYHEFEDRIDADIKAQVENPDTQIMTGEFTVEINDEEPALRVEHCSDGDRSERSRISQGLVEALSARGAHVTRPECVIKYNRQSDLPGAALLAGKV